MSHLNGFNRLWFEAICLKYLSPIGSKIKFLFTTFWFLWNLKHHNHATFKNQKVVTENFIIEPTGVKYYFERSHDHKYHIYKFFPSWTAESCGIIFALEEFFKLQTRHLKCLLLRWTFLTCLLKVNVSKYDFLYISQGNLFGSWADFTCLFETNLEEQHSIELNQFKFKWYGITPNWILCFKAKTGSLTRSQPRFTV